MHRLVAILLACTLLAGCSDPGPTTADAPTGTQTETSTSSPGPSGEPRNGTAPDEPPTASITASVANGTAPFTTNFTLQGHDPEGANLSWEFDSLGNGTFPHNGSGLPANVEQLFDAPGSYTVRLRVSDGNHTVEANLTVVALPAAAAPYQSAEGGISGDSLVCHGGPDTDTGKVVIDIDLTTWGEPFTITFRSGAAHDAYAFLDAAGTELASGSGGLSGGGWTFSGTVPDAAATLSLYACGNTFDETYAYVAGTPPPA